MEQSAGPHSGSIHEKLKENPKMKIAERIDKRLTELIRFTRYLFSIMPAPYALAASGVSRSRDFMQKAGVIFDEKILPTLQSPEESSLCLNRNPKGFKNKKSHQRSITK